MKSKNKYYNLKNAMLEYSIQDIPNPEINKTYCIVKRSMVLDYVEFRNLLMEYGIVDQDLKKEPEVQECSVKKNC